MNLWTLNAIAAQLNTPWASSYQPESEAIFAAMIPEPSVPRKILIDDLVVFWKNAGVFSKLDCLHVLIAHSAQATGVNWVNPSGALGAGGVWTSDVSVAGDPDTSDVFTTAFTPSDGVKFRAGHAEMGYYLHSAASRPSGSSAKRLMFGCTDTPYDSLLNLQEHEDLGGNPWCMAYRKTNNRLHAYMCADLWGHTPINVANDVGLFVAGSKGYSPPDAGLQIWKQGDASNMVDGLLVGGTFGLPSLAITLSSVNMPDGFSTYPRFVSDAELNLFYAGADLTIAEREVIAAGLEAFKAAV